MSHTKTFTALAILVLTLAGGPAAPTAMAAHNDELPPPDEVRNAVEAMKQEEVAWRKIDWRTCLVEGLHESRKQNKPVLLWIFIDRPIDDERC